MIKPSPRARTAIDSCEHTEAPHSFLLQTVQEQTKHVLHSQVCAVSDFD